MLQRHLAKRTFQHASPLAAAHFELHHPLQPWLLPAEGFRIWTLELHNVDLWAIWFIFGPILKNVWSGAKIKQIWSLKKSGILAYPPFTLFNVRSRQKTCVHAGFTLVSRCFTLWFFQNFQLPFLMLQCNFPAFTGFFASHPHVARTLQTSNLLAWRCQRAHTHATAHTIPTWYPISI